MRSIKQFFTIILIVAAIFSCHKKKDPCENTVCQNGGTCVDGTCNCPPGFTGADCGTAIVTTPSYNMTANATYTVCEGNFYDGGGASGPYPANQNVTVTFVPSTTGAMLSVTFSSFKTYNATDILYVYNGNSTSSPLIGTLSSAYNGYGTITSTATDGSLTFKFISDASANSNTYEPGWAATIACNITPNDITMLASGTFTTCGGKFYDGGGPTDPYMPNQNVITTLKPANASDKLGVTFNSFKTYNATDILYVYDGNSTSAPLIGTLYSAYNGYGTILSTATDGSLTFKFVSDASTNSNTYEPGWDATIACNPSPNDITMLASGTFTTCSGNFYDGGGPTGPYMPNQNVITTLKPTSASDKLGVTFNSFKTYNATDVLYVYNGNSTSAPLIGTLYSAYNGYGTILSTATDGSLTFKFISDASANSNTYEPGWDATIACNPSPNDITMLASGTFTTCSGNFYDSGGPSNPYMPNQNVVTTLKPTNTANKIRVAFSAFTTYNAGDILYIYDGNSTSAPLIGQYTSTTSPGTVTSTASDGTLTFKFVSDASANSNTYEPGWAATISCQ